MACGERGALLSAVDASGEDWASLVLVNFDLPDLSGPVDNIRGNQIPDLEKLHGYDLSKYRLPNKRQVLRNCVTPEIGSRILDAAVASRVGV